MLSYSLSFLFIYLGGRVRSEEPGGPRKPGAMFTRPVGDEYECGTKSSRL